MFVSRTPARSTPGCWMENGNRKEQTASQLLGAGIDSAIATVVAAVTSRESGTAPIEPGIGLVAGASPG